MPFNMPRITKALLIANLVGFGLQWLLGDARMQVFELWPIGDGLYDPSGSAPSFMPWQLLSYGFMHDPTDIFHLIFNMFTLFFFGRQIEGWMAAQKGPWVFPLFYFSALVVSILPTYLKHQKDPNYRSLGASGAVSAVLFAFILLAPWATIGVFFIPMPAIVFAVLYIAYSIWMDKRGGDNINHGAHLAGAAYGVLFLVVMDAGVIGHFLEELSHPSFG